MATTAETDGSDETADLGDTGDTGGSDAVPARWRVAVAFVLSLLGLGISVYLTVDHFAKIPLVCSDTGLINCEKVTTSAQSYFLGIPVAVLGLAFYTAMTVINLPMLWYAADRRIHMLRLAMAGVGVLFALYLVSAELLIIGNICLWCTSVHVVTFLLFVLIVTTVPRMLGWGSRDGRYEEDEWYEEDESEG